MLVLPPKSRYDAGNARGQSQVVATGSPQSPDRNFRFGPFELIEREGELRKNGVRIKLQEQPFQVLHELVSNAGKIVTREELQQRLWPEDTFVDFNVGVNTAVRKLRLALNDDADKPRYIETLSKRGYRFIAPVQSDQNESATLAQVQPEVPSASTTAIPAKPANVQPAPLLTLVWDAAAPHPDKSADETGNEPAEVHAARWKWLAAGACTAALAAGMAYWWMQPAAPAVVEGIKQVTDDGQPKGVFNSLQTDGTRLYFNEGRRGNLQIAQVAVTGGQVSIIPTSLIDPQPGGVASDGSFLSVLQGGAAPPGQPVWKVPLPSGDPVRIGNLKGQDTSVTPDGRIMVGYESELIIVDADGSNPHTVISGVDAWVGNPSMSPDGKQIAFSYYGHKGLSG
jgi:DNA-binding winged helix-turn-helix (wHTH) protein